MHEDIQIIQNALWKYYKQLVSDNDMGAYNKNIQSLVAKFKDKPNMLSFCQNLIISWAPIVNAIKADSENVI